MKPTLPSPLKVSICIAMVSRCPETLIGVANPADKVGFPCGVGLGEDSFGIVTNLGNSTLKQPERAMNGLIAKDSVLARNSRNRNFSLSQKMNLHNIAIKKEKHRDGLFNIQKISS